jgi:putative ABC transport system substrate-binding protein
MRRRDFIKLLAALATAQPAGAQQRSPVWRLGCLFPNSGSEVYSLPYFAEFRRRLREFGYVEGQNLILDVRTAEGDYSRLGTLAADLVELHPDVIVAVATPAVLAAQQATSSIPIVMASTGDPVGSGFVKSLAKPGGNITGVSMMSPDLSAKSLEFLTELVPKAKRVAALRSPNPAHTAFLKEMDAAGQRLGLTIIPVVAVTPSDLVTTFESMVKEGYDGLVVLNDPRLTTHIPELAAKARLPAIYQFPGFGTLSGLLSYGPDLSELWGIVTVYVDRILKGANPADLPVAQPTKFELVINLKAAKALGLAIPTSLLLRADEVIE